MGILLMNMLYIMEILNPLLLNEGWPKKRLTLKQQKLNRQMRY
jgi:hypothetical protein